MLIFFLVYFLAFSSVLAWGFVWVMERGEKKYHLGANHSGPAFLWGSMLFILSYIGNIVVFCTARSAFQPLQLSLLGGLLAFGWLREAGYRTQHHLANRGVRKEINRLEKGLTDDPSNASYHERLSELYEKNGDLSKAERHAEAACGLDRTERNKWRVKILRQDLEGISAGRTTA